MRRKSMNPKKVYLKDLRMDDRRARSANEFVIPLPSDLPSKEKERLVKFEMKNFNGSQRETKVALSQPEKLVLGNTQVSTFQSLSTNDLQVHKCSCFVAKKDQCTQTLGYVQECSTPSAVIPSAAAAANLPSPSWSHSSDSDGSLPTTPRKIKSYGCSVCAKTFPTPSKLRRHLLIHSGEKPYSCRVCNKPFNDQANLKRHHWSHVKEKPFICGECRGEFMTKRDAMMHLCPSIKRRGK